MKKNVLFLFVALVILGHCGFTQNNEASQFTKEEAVAAIKINYLFMYFRYPEDTIANINRLIDNMSEVVLINKEKSDKIKVLILSEIKQAEKKMSVNHVLGLQRYDLPGFIPIMGINANDIVKNSFSSSDYEKIYDRLVKDRINAKNAYRYLRILYNEERRAEGEDGLIVNAANPKPFLDRIFKHYGI
ncbi:MAG: hypothetical protein FWE63_02060 [Bacteroidales bacterium]|nr:hypothetical protein [Bacteroidales bacterium]